MTNIAIDVGRKKSYFVVELTRITELWLFRNK